MNQLTIDHDFDELAAYLRGAPDSMIDAADKAMHRGALDMQRAAMVNAPKFQSQLTKSIHLERKGPLDYLISTGQDYALAQEEGTDPGYFPNTAPGSDLYQWVVKNTDGDPARTAFLIGRSIQQKGTEAKEYMKRAYEDNIDPVTKRIFDSIDRGLAV